MDLTPAQLRIDPERLSQKLEKFIHTSVHNLNRDGAIIGLSGGLDSSVVLALSVAALGPDKVLGLIMPERIASRTVSLMPDSRLMGWVSRLRGWN